MLSAIFAAMVYVLTSFLKIPTHQGYIHVGDGIIFLAASLLPMPYAMAAGALGAGLSDYLSGYPMWVLPTVLIKMLTVIAFTHRKETIVNKRNLLSLLPAAVLCVGGYYLASAMLYGDFGAAVADVPTNLIQSVTGSVLFVALGIALDKMSFKKRFLPLSTQKKQRP